jgi:hypothetical protein
MCLVEGLAPARCRGDDAGPDFLKPVAVLSTYMPVGIYPRYCIIPYANPMSM